MVTLNSLLVNEVCLMISWTISDQIICCVCTSRIENLLESSKVHEIPSPYFVVDQHHPLMCWTCHHPFVFPLSTCLAS